MKNKIQKIWDFIFKIDPNFQKIPLRITRKNVNIDTNLQAVLLSHFLSMPYENSSHNISTIIRPSNQKEKQNGPH